MTNEGELNLFLDKKKKVNWQIGKYVIQNEMCGVLDKHKILNYLWNKKNKTFQICF